MVNTQTGEIEIDLIRLIRAVRRRWMPILLSVLLGAVAFFVGARLLPARYESGVMIYVCSDSGEELSSEHLSIARKLVESCMVLLNTRQTQQGILDHTGLPLTCQELEQRIRAEAMGDTEFFYVTVTGDDPVEAEQIADAIGEILPDRVGTLLEGYGVKVADAAVLPQEPSGPDDVRSALTGAALGLILGVSLALLADLKKQLRK